MKTLNIAEARSEFSALVDEVRLGGEGVVISKYGRPVAMLVSYRQPAESKDASNPFRRDWRAERGLRDDSFVLPPDFDEPMDDMWSVFTEAPEDFKK